MEKEDGEMSDENAMLIDDIDEKPSTKQDNNHTILFKTAKNGIVMEKLEKVDSLKLEERAERFGLNLVGGRAVTQKQIDELYEKAGITGNERHFRFDTIHLNGIEGLSTRDIFEYLEDYKPVAMEKIDDVSCNIVCQDHIAAALALLVHSREIKNDTLNEILSEKSQHHWREGMPHPKKDLILMRFATNADKKMPKNKERDEKKRSDEYYDQSMDPVSKNPWGDLCKSWGVYDHQEVFQRKLPLKHDYEDEVEERMPIKNKTLAMRLGKRRHTVEENQDSDSDSGWKKKSKAPRMRMRADDEESKQRKKPAQRCSEDDVNIYEERDKFAPLSIEVVNSQDDYDDGPRQATKLSDKFKSHSKNNQKQGNILLRLGAKVAPAEEKDWSDDGSSNKSEPNILSRVQKVRNTATTTSNVWSRLDSAVCIKDSSQDDLRQILKSKKEKKSDDLRERLSKAKKSNLRIEIDNY